MPRKKCSHPTKQLGFNLKQVFGAVVSRKLNATTGAALLGTDARLLNQEFRRLLEPAAGPPEAGSRQLGFRELLYFELISSLGEQGLQLSPTQKQEVYGLLVRRLGRSSVNWRRRPGQLVRQGPVPLSLDLSAVGRDIRYRYRLVKRPQQLVETNPSICSGQPVFRGTRIPLAVVVEQLRAGTSRQELELDFPQLSYQALDYAEIQARLPKPPGRPRKSLKLLRA
jgi:uncharacterized protein (DUF433 family)